MSFGSLKKVRSVFSIYRGLPRGVYVLFIATIVNGVGIFVFPFLTLFLTEKLGMNALQAGNFMFFTSIAYLPGAIIGGKLADYFGRRKVMLVAQLSAAAMFIPCGILTLDGTPAAVLMIPVFILLNIIADGFADPARGAMQTDLTTPENRRAAFSLTYLGHNLGFALGPLIAGFLFHSAPQWLFWGNAIAAVSSMALVVGFIPESKPTEETMKASLLTNSSEKAHEGGLLSAVRSRPFLILFVFLTAWFGFVYAQHRFSLPLLTQSLFGERGAALYGSLMTLNAVLVIVFTAPIIALLSRLKPIVNVAIAGVLFAAGFGMLAFVRTPLMFLVSTSVWTVGEIVEATNSHAYVANNTPMSHRGRFHAILPFIGGFGWAISTPVGGRFIESMGLRTPWLLYGAIAAVVSVLLLGLSRLERRAGTVGTEAERTGTNAEAM